MSDTTIQADAEREFVPYGERVAAHKRTQRIAALRELADLLDSHPEVPAPGFIYEYPLGSETPPREQIVAMVESLDASVKVTGSTLEIRREFPGGVAAVWQIPGEAVFEKREVTREEIALPDELASRVRSES